MRFRFHRRLAMPLRFALNVSKRGLSLSWRPFRWLSFNSRGRTTRERAWHWHFDFHRREQ